jgi:glycosyltransferase involved in cell wall biosynthesis
MNTVSQTLVSIVTPVYNGAEHLVEYIESVLAQTYQNWDCPIVLESGAFCELILESLNHVF